MPGAPEHLLAITIASRILVSVATFAVVMTLVGLLAPQGIAFPNLRRWTRGMAANMGLSMAWVMIVAALVATSFHLFGPPLPSTNDDFSYLLASDTFSAGRLTNPRHSLWPHFEAIGTIQFPGYASKYPPLQGLLLAVGQLLFGQPGILISVAFVIACGVATWALRPWLGPRWTLIGGLLLAVHPYMQSTGRYYLTTWSNYSWSHGLSSGALAMLGGAMIFGAFPRLIRKPRWWLGLVFALGLAILANTRPFEGLVLAAPLGIFLLWTMLRGKRFALPVVAKTILVPCTITMTITFGLMLLYNKALTGNALVNAHAHHRKQYGAAAEFLFSPAQPLPEYRNETMRIHYEGWVRPTYLAQRSEFWAYESVKKYDLIKMFSFYAAWIWPGLLGAALALKRRRWRFAAALTFLTLSTIFIVFQAHPHYLAPATVIFWALVIAGLRELWLLPSKLRRLTKPIVALTMIGFSVQCLAQLPTARARPAPDNWPAQRAMLVKQLEHVPGKDMVFVNYSLYHNHHKEWVHNRANIDEEEIVWARELDFAQDWQLTQYFADRRAWLLLADLVPPVLRPYPYEQMLVRGAQRNLPGIPLRSKKIRGQAEKIRTWLVDRLSEPSKSAEPMVDHAAHWVNLMAMELLLTSDLDTAKLGDINNLLAKLTGIGLRDTDRVVSPDQKVTWTSNERTLTLDLSNKNLRAALTPWRAVLLAQRGFIESRLGNDVAAHDLLVAANTEQPLYIETTFGYLLSFGRALKPDKGLTELDRFSPTIYVFPALFQLRYILQRAMVFSEQYNRLSPEEQSGAAGYTARAQIYLTMMAYGRGRNALQEAIRLNPRYRLPYEILALEHAAAGENQAAWDVVEQMRTQFGDDLALANLENRLSPRHP